mmetsp:Transcript_19003/g.46688  ORF Transcript_19003/g.46688 Transcript_19003/m.46688 type:complete len:222 (-) Transcript_19003:176-841(-)
MASRAQKILSDAAVGADLPDLRDLEDGGVLWKASLVLLHYLETKVLEQIKGKRVLELGSGSGHLGISLACLGAHVTCTERKEMQTLERLQARVETAQRQVEESGSGGSIRALELSWGEAGFQRSQLASEGVSYDVVVMSELVYDEDSHDELLETFVRVCTGGCVAFSIFCDRPWSQMWFVKLHDEGGYAVQPVAEGDIDLLGMQPDAKVLMHVIRPNRSSN